MITPSSLEEIASYVEQEGKKVLSFQLTGVGIAVISSLFCRRLRLKIPNLSLS